MERRKKTKNLKTNLKGIEKKRYFFPLKKGNLRKLKGYAIFSFF